MKIMAIGTIAAFSPEQKQKYMPTEVPATLQLYLDGKIEQFWFRQDAPGPVFLMNADSIEQATAELATLPLVAAQIMSFQLIPVGPLSPLGLLIHTA